MNSRKRFYAFTLIVTMIFSLLPINVNEVMKVMAAEGSAISDLNTINQNTASNFSAVKTTEGKISISNDSSTGGFASSGITNTSYLLTPNKISGDFSVEATLKVTSRTINGTGGVVGVGAFSGTGDKDAFVAAVARGDNGSRSYYQKADGSFGAGSPNLASTSTAGTPIALKLERTADKYTVTINGESKELSGLNANSAGDMYLGLVVAGAVAEVDSLVIKQGANLIYSQVATASGTPSGEAPSQDSTPLFKWTSAVNPTIKSVALSGDGLEATVNFDMVMGALGATNVEVIMEKDGALVESKVVKEAISANGASNGSVTFKPATSGKYIFTAKATRDGEADVKTSNQYEYMFTLPSSQPVGNTSSSTDGQWKSIVFGQSTSANNTVEVDSAKNQVTISAGAKDGSAAGGKITGSHDGIAYYYTEVDPSKNFEISADIKVNYFAKAKPDNQEGFGIMARDAIGKSGDTTVFASNMAMVGGYRGLIQSVFRNEVKDISGAGAKMEDVFKFGDRPANDGTATYKMTMKKTNTGYIVSVDNGAEKIYYRPKQLEVLDSGKIYVGFFAARVASITVSNINMKTSDVATDAPGVPEPAKGITPLVKATSLSATSSTNYDLKVSANVQGNLQVKLADKEIYNGAVEANKELVLNTTLVSGDNSFDMILTPASTEEVTSADPVNVKKVVTVKSYGVPGGEIYVSQTGTANATGTENDPIDIYSAIKFISEGQTIYARGGVYNLTAPVIIERGNDGTSDKPKVLSAYKNERPVFDFGNKSQGVNLAGDSWKIYGIDVTKATANPFKVSGNYNVVELVNSYANEETGIQISGSSLESKDKWPSNNLILNCTAYDNRDASENNADGFAAKLTVGPGNVFRGCISHHNTDDGWDLYSKLESGPIEPVIIENCVAYGNGTLTNGTKTKGDGNGFKLGGEGLPVKHILRNSLSFGNDSNGVTSNSDPAIIVENVTSVDNKKANFSFAFYANATPQFAAKNNISFRTTAAGEADSFPSYLASEDNYFYNGTASVNASGKQVLAKDFKSVTAPTSVARTAEGNISIGDYMVLASDSSIKSGANLYDFSIVTNPGKVPAASNDSNKESGKIQSPKTGDFAATNIIIFAVLALLSAAGIVGFRKKNIN